MMEDTFKGKRILITGASKGIGFALAKELDSLGASLLLHASSDEGYERLWTHFEGQGHIFWQADFFKPQDLEKGLMPILDEFGPLDGFVNCVGVRLRRPVNLLNVSIVQDTFNANFTSYLEIIRLITKKNRFQSGMSILSISSISAYSGAPGVSIYAATKGALESATRCLAKELQKKEIRINTIVCGQIDTEAYQELMETKDGADPVLERQFMGLGKPQQVVDIIIFMLSEKSSFISGASIPADGGFLS